MLDGRATLIYDGDCGICRYWVDAWQQETGDRVAYRAYQEAAADFPDIPVDVFQHAIQLVEPDGSVFSGAAATFRVLRHAGNGAWWWAYRNLPGWAPVSERGYSFFARRRNLLARITYCLWGREPRTARYDLVSRVFLRLLGLLYAVAFASLATQVLALIGKGGILPAGDYLAAARQGWGVAAYARLPTVFWLDAADTLIVAGAWLGTALGGLVALGICVRPALIALYVLYLSYVYAGQVFMSFQWDLLLLEAGFLAIFLTTGSRIVVWLYRWLLFRFLFLSGAVKLLSGDHAWQSLTALEYHFWTQPLPTPLAWPAAGLPSTLLVAGAAATLIIELAVAFLVFAPRRPRAFAAFCVLAFQLLILLTGNYGFFNLLTMALCLFLFDDAALRRLVPSGTGRPRTVPPSRAATAAAAAMALVAVPVGLERIWEPFAHTRLPLLATLTDAVSPLLIVNPYGPFSTTTTHRPEIVVEGSDDGRSWREYAFRYKPGPVDRPPSWNIPHQPRLDWQMWFAAYGTALENPWFPSLLHKLLEGDAATLGLLASNPFPSHPPKFVRALLFDYRFADVGSGASRHDWWVRREEGSYYPAVSLENFPQAASR
jgi:predicted DCC family thiol-disulfide oxidoreductase YuxK